MDLLTPELRDRLVENGRTPDADRPPVVKLFNPCGAGTWLLADADPDDPDRLFGLADLGLGAPELGYVSLRELQSFRGPFGLGIERDLYFDARFPLSVYAEAARRAGRICEFGSELEAAAAERGA